MAGCRRSTARQDKQDRELLRHLSRHYDLGNGTPRPDPIECVPLTLEEGSFRHGHWGARRAKIFKALQLAGTGRRQLERFDTCGSQARVFWSPTRQQYTVRASYCFAVDVRAISNFENVTHELTKYVTKSTSGDVWEDEQLAIEWICAARGTRSCATFGTWRNFKLTERPEDPGDWVHVGTLTDVVRAAARREAWAVGVILNLRPPGLKDDTS
jgi:hypothetical protein